MLSGDNVLFRSFSYIRSTPRNRRSFIRQLRDTHKNFEQQRGEPASPEPAGAAAECEAG